MTDDVRRSDIEGAEAWQRLSDERELRSVEAISLDHDEWRWSVIVAVLEFIRDEPLESELRAAIAASLKLVRGVTRIAEDDREVWIVAGSAQGEDLVRAVARCVDAFADRTREYTGFMP